MNLMIDVSITYTRQVPVPIGYPVGRLNCTHVTRNFKFIDNKFDLKNELSQLNNIQLST
jgi:hypothetical protein